MVSVDISLTPSLPGATLSLSLSLNKRILGDFTGYYVFSEEFASDRRKASRGSVNQNVAGQHTEFYTLTYALWALTFVCM